MILECVSSSLSDIDHEEGRCNFIDLGKINCDLKKVTPLQKLGTNGCSLFNKGADYKLQPLPLRQLPTGQPYLNIRLQVSSSGTIK